MHLHRFATIDASAPSTGSTRIVSVDLLRGLVMMLMALDHTRDYFSGLPYAPEDLSKTFGALFFTRVITHICAPVFFLLAGAGAYLAVARGKSRRYLPTFFGLPFQAEIGSEPLLAAIDLVRRLDSDELKALPVDAPCDFVPAAWRAALEGEDGSLERNIWEIALGLAVRDALRAGDLNLAESRRHVSFWNLAYDENQWANQRKEAYTALVLPNEADRVLDKLRQEYMEAVEKAEGGLADNPFATIRDGRLRLKRPDALEVPERVKQVKRVPKSPTS